MNPLEKIITYLFGAGKRVNENTPTGYKSYYKQTDPNLIQRVLGQSITPSSGTSPTPMPSLTPTPSPMPSPKLEGYQGYNINRLPVEGSNPRLPNDLKQLIMSVFEPDKEATGAARLLTHPMALTNIPGEQERGVNLGPNAGENPLFNTTIDTTNDNGTIDRGLYRINSMHFFNPGEFNRRKKLMQSVGIDVSSPKAAWDDMKDQYKNMLMARIILREQGYKSFYAAPQDLRLKGYGGGE